MSLPPRDRETLLREMCPDLPQQISPGQDQTLQETLDQIKSKLSV